MTSKWREWHSRMLSSRFVGLRSENTTVEIGEYKSDENRMRAETSQVYVAEGQKDMAVKVPSWNCMRHLVESHRSCLTNAVEEP